MSRQALDPVEVRSVSVATTELVPPARVPGIDPLDIPNLSEQQAFMFASALNEHIKRRNVRDSILRGHLVGVKHGNKNLFSRRAVLAWMTGGAA